MNIRVEGVLAIFRVPMSLTIKHYVDFINGKKMCTVHKMTTE